MAQVDPIFNPSLALVPVGYPMTHVPGSGMLGNHAGAVGNAVQGVATATSPTATTPTTAVSKTLTQSGHTGDRLK